MTRFLRYTLIGSSAFALDLGLLYVFIDYVGLHYLTAAVVSFGCASTLHYVLSRRLVFQGTTRTVRDGYVFFVGIELVGMVVVAGCMYLLVEHTTLEPMVARVCVAGITGTWNYLMNLYVNFKVAGYHVVVIPSAGGVDDRHEHG